MKVEEKKRWVDHWPTHIVALAIFVVLATFILWPVGADPRHIALGHEANDVWNHVWGYWWFAEKLSGGEMPLHTDLLNWPDGGTLWFIDAFGAFITLPIQWIWGPVAAYNAAIWFNFVLAGVGAYVLALRVSGSLPGAVVAGVAFLTAPHLLGQAYNGISETMAVGWFPLTIAAMMAAKEKPTARRGAVVGFVWACNALSNWYYGLFSGIFFLVFLADLIGRWLREWRRHRKIWKTVRPYVVSGGTSALILGCMVVGPFWFFLASMQADDAVVMRNQGFVWMTLVLHNMSDLVSFVRPGKNYSPDLKKFFDEDLIVVIYLGHAVLWPAVIGSLFARKRQQRPVRFWFAMGLFFGSMTLGPFLYIGGDYIHALGGWIPMPFLAFYKWVPMFSRISHAYRFVMGAMLCLVMLLALCIRTVDLRWHKGLAAAVVIGVARVIESFWGSPAVIPVSTVKVEVPAIYAELKGGAVWDVPVGVPVLRRAEYSMYQMLHKQPIPYGLNDPTPTNIFYNRFSQYLVELERTTLAYLPPQLPMFDIELGRADFAAMGLKWIVVHREHYPEPQYRKVEAYLDLMTTRYYADDEITVYRLDP